MSIQPLGKEVAVLLRASALVVTPLSLIKELVDNAIDAKATSIRVQVARNGVDQIEVQDNGVGICAADFDVLGRRAHTSKLRAFQDLPRIGGESLGFRGEALAATNSVSEVTVTTRTAQEKVGHRVRLESKVGGVKEQNLVSIPAGTTVRVQNLFANIPVRKKISVDKIQKTIADVKHLLQAYALARPHIRLSFGVIGDNKASWTYSPVGAPTVREAASQILGKGVVSQCIDTALTEPGSSPNDKLVEELTERGVSRITVDAFLPKPDADLAAVSKKGAFLSVDGRPLTSGRGTMKKVVSAFKARFDALHPRQGIQPSASNVFIRLDIQCPPGSYDINVSPAKDEVLFTDEERVLKIVDDLLQATYASTEIEDTPQQPDGEELNELSADDLQILESFAITHDEAPGPVDPLQSSLDNSGLTVDFAPDDGDQLNFFFEEDNASLDSRDSNVALDTAWLIDMSAPCDDDDVPQPKVTSVIDQLRNAASQRAQKSDDEANSMGEGREKSPPPHSKRPEPLEASASSFCSWTSAADAPNPWTIAAKAAGARPQPYTAESFETNSAFDTDGGEVNRGRALNLQFTNYREAFPISPSPDIPRSGVFMCTPPRMLGPPPTSALQTPPPSDGRVPRQRNTLPRFKPLTVSAPRARQPEGTRPQARPRQGLEQVGAPNHEDLLAPYGEHPLENRLSLDAYMGTNEAPIQPPTELGLADPFLSPPLAAGYHVPADVPSMSDLPPAASVNIEGPGVLDGGRRSAMDAAAADEIPGQEDPRKYLMKRRRSMSRDRRAGRVLRRVKSTLLPLETIPADQEMQVVSVGIATSHVEIRPAVFCLVYIDQYVSIGTSQSGLPDDLEGAADIQARLQDVFGEWAQRTTGAKCDLELNLRSQMKGKYSG